jgi:uncharacterized membrane protein
MTIILGAIAVLFLLILMYKWKRFIIPVLVGGFLGSFVGIAGFGGAVAGTIPGAVLGAIIAIAYVSGKKIGK